ncbi:peptidoglycan-binding protein LysM [Mesorhizobium sp. L-8-10]|uniref:Ig-like domain-containing protein n=1 Tax=Mesorhizobium sp. L-8-10 TaxID=2744523 RepID=UPI001925420A|nr:Ig-like domain-containing protein [Mesorhizobium sp. L-8-10]BCH33840.1 peptidoglycan-binding protein LysM [Mesorhizobium sp. L-8-10]
MVVNPLKAILFLAGGAAAVAGAAYVSGALDSLLVPPPAVVAALPGTQPDAAAPKAERLPGAEPAMPSAGTVAPALEAAAPAPPDSQGPAVPSFDIVRVEPDGSVVIAGKAAPEAQVDLQAGGGVIGGAKADASGDFAIVLDKPLAPGDYQLTLRATPPAGAAVPSAETAVVSIPKAPGGPVLAMVEQPGKPSQIITTPQPAPAGPAPAAATEPAQPPAAVQSPVEAEPAAPKPAEPAATAAPAKPSIAVQAVEIEGKKVFVAGMAQPGQRVRVYADEILLGEAKTDANGRFLVEAERDLPVGSYIIRADVLGADGLQIVARAAVPFEREPGEAIAAVASPAPAQSASPEPAAPAAVPEKAAAPEKPDAQAGEKPANTPSEPAVASAEQRKAATEIAANPPDVTAPKLQAVESAVIIRRGDTLWRISRRVYGRGVRYSTIYLANQDQISNPDRIWPGQVFSVPHKTEEGEAADMKAMGEQMTSKPGAADTAATAVPKAQ